MRALPVGRALVHAVKSTYQNLPFAFHISWPWMLLLFPAHFVSAFHGRDIKPLIDPHKPDPALVMKLLSVEVPVLVLSTIALASIAVSWHRFILLDEVPRGFQRLRIDQVVLRYFGNSLLLILGIVAAALVLSLVITVVGAMTFGVGYAIAFPLMILLIAGVFRVSVKFPAVALGRRDFTFRNAWTATEGNMWQIALFSAIVTAATFAFQIFVSAIALLFEDSGWDAALFVALALQFALSWVAVILSTTLLTSLYGYFVEGRSF